MWLGGKTFPNERFLRWSNRWTPAPVRMSTKVGITGKTIVFGQAQVGGREIILKGWLTQDEWNNLNDLYAAAGQDYALIFDSGEQFQHVVIMSIESRAVLDRIDPRFIEVTITLLTVVP